MDEDGPLASIIRKIFYSEEPQLTDAIADWITVRQLQQYRGVVVSALSEGSRFKSCSVHKKLCPLTKALFCKAGVSV